MKRSSKNYLTLVTGLLLLYFLILTVFGAIETRHDLERMNPDVPAVLSDNWYILLAILGAGFLACLVWGLVSRANRLSVSEVFHRPLNWLLLPLGTLAGGAAAFWIGGSAIGVVPEIRIPLLTQQGSQVVQAPASESAPAVEPDESVYHAPVPELPPIKPVENRISQAAGLSTIADLQTVSGTLQSTTPDQSTLLAVDQSAVTLDQAILLKGGDSTNPENAMLFGLNAALLAAPGATVNVLGSTIETSATGAGAAAVNGLNASVTLTSSSLSTLQSESPVLFAGFQGQMKVTAGTQISRGEHSPVFVSRSSSAIEADSITAQSYGARSPIIRASGAFTGSSLNANALSANLAQIEPGGNVSLTGSSLSAGGIQSEGVEPAMFIFDNEDGSGKQEPGRLALNSCEWIVNPSSPAAGSLWNFYVNGCSAVVNLTNNTILDIAQAAKVKGGQLTLNLQNQSLSGPVVGDASSMIDMTLIEGSRFEGALNADNTCPDARLHLDETSTVSLSADIYLSDFGNDNPTNSNIQTNGHHIYLNGEMIL